MYHVYNTPVTEVVREGHHRPITCCRCNKRRQGGHARVPRSSRLLLGTYCMYCDGEENVDNDSPGASWHFFQPGRDTVLHMPRAGGIIITILIRYLLEAFCFRKTYRCGCYYWRDENQAAQASWKIAPSLSGRACAGRWKLCGEQEFGGPRYFGTTRTRRSRTALWGVQYSQNESDAHCHERSWGEVFINLRRLGITAKHI
jgi:hypothetical protein